MEHLRLGNHCMDMAQAGIAYSSDRLSKLTIIQLDASIIVAHQVSAEG
jgi:hypothetical protein